MMFRCLVMVLAATLAIKPLNVEAKIKVRIACDTLPAKKKYCKEEAEAWALESGNEVEIVEAPTGSSNRFAWIQQLLGAHDSKIHVFQIDTTWPGALKDHFIPLDDLLTRKEKDLYHPKLLQNNTVNGCLLALPWYVDVGLLIYRKDLLEKHGKPVPQTWEELGETARFIQDAERKEGQDKIWGLVFSAKAFEGLTCNIVEWIGSTGGSIVTPEGDITIQQPQAAVLLGRLASWMDTLVPLGALNYAEEDTRGVFQSGNAVFMRHWPYVIRLANDPDSPIKGKVGVALLPKEGPNGRHASAVGGWQLAVSKYCPNEETQQAALSLVKYLASKDSLRRRAIRGGYFPPMPSLYEEAEVKAALNDAGLVLQSLNEGALRPSTQTETQYNKVSVLLQNEVHKILLGQVTPDKALEVLQKKLSHMAYKGQWGKVS